MHQYNKAFIALILACSFLMVGCFAPKNHNESVHEKMKDHDRQLE